MKNKLSLLTFGLLTILLAGACKKTTTTAGGSIATNTGNAAITPTTATSYFAILSITSSQSVWHGTVLNPPINFSEAYFSNTAMPYTTPPTFVKVDSVSLNGRHFKFMSYDYQDTTYSVSYPPATWQIKGLATIPSFTYTSTTPFPTYTGYATLPDTVHINQDVTIAVTGVAGSDQTTVIISDGSNASGHTVSQTLAAGANSVTFPASSLSSLTLTSTTTSTVTTISAFINIDCIKNNVQAVNGLPMNFLVSYQLDKNIYIKQ